MASFSFHGIDELSHAFDLDSNIPEEVKKTMLKQMGEVLLEATKAEGEAQGVRDPNSSVHILDTLTLSKPTIGKDKGEIKVTFKGKRTDKKHKTPTRNAEIAFINEFGIPSSDKKKGQKAKPFVSDAILKNADKINEAGAKILSTYLDKN